MLWQEWLTTARKGEITTKLRQNLVKINFIKKATDVSADFMALIYEALDGQYIDRALYIETPDSMTAKAVNLLTDLVPDFLNGLKKFEVTELLGNPENWGIKTKLQNLDRQGAVATETEQSPERADSFLAQEMNTHNQETQQIDYLSSARSFANSYFWRAGLYDKLINAFASYVIPFIVFEW